MTTNRAKSVKRVYPLILEASLVVALLIVTTVFILSKSDDRTIQVPEVQVTEIEITDIPVIPPDRKQPPPERPSVPVEDPDIPLEEMMDMISPADWKFNLPALPDYSQNDANMVYDFFAVQKEPEIVGGTQALYSYMMEHDLYPDMARRLGNEGAVQVEFVVSVQGKATSFVVLDERPKGLGFAEAAIEAITAMAFTPGEQRDKRVAVRMKQTILFKLR